MVFDFWLYCWLISCTFANKQTLGINLSNHSFRTVASDKLSVERFEQRMKVKMII